MSDSIDQRLYPDSAASAYLRWLIDRVMEDRAESAPLPPDDDDD